MRTRRAALLALAAGTSILALAGTAWGAGPFPGQGYVWAQPGCSSVSVTSAEAASYAALPSMAPCGGYGWMQPGTSVAGVTTVQPAG